MTAIGLNTLITALDPEGRGGAPPCRRSGGSHRRPSPAPARRRNPWTRCGHHPPLRGRRPLDPRPDHHSDARPDRAAQNRDHPRHQAPHGPACPGRSAFKEEFPMFSGKSIILPDGCRKRRLRALPRQSRPAGRSSLPPSARRGAPRQGANRVTLGTPRGIREYHRLSRQHEGLGRGAMSWPVTRTSVIPIDRSGAAQGGRGRKTAVPREAQTAVGKAAAGNWGNGIVARGEPPGAKWPGDIRSVRNV